MVNNHQTQHEPVNKKIADSTQGGLGYDIGEQAFNLGQGTDYSSNEILYLQRTMGNQGVLNLLEQRKQSRYLQRVNTTPTTLHKGRDLTNMTLENFQLYAEGQIDWFNSTDVSDDQRRKLRTLLGFASQKYALSGAGHINAGDLIGAGVVSTQIKLNNDKVDAIKAYGRAVDEGIIQTRDSNEYNILRYGKRIKKLYDTPAIASIMEHTFKQDPLIDLVGTDKRVDDLIKYFNTCSPSFEADNGQDLVSFLELRKEVDPSSYASSNLSGKIKNFHRFEKAALDRLKRNYAKADLPNNQRKPLTLILHTAKDHNGAFHRDPFLTAVIVNNDILTLLIEGKDTLADVQSELAPLAKKYGKDGKIDQVMFAGHGNARVIELGASEDVDLDSNASDSNALFDEILKNMSNDPTVSPHRRIVFNACLTGSNSVEVPLGSDMAKAQKTVRDFIGANSSLATHVQNRAKSKGLDKIDVKGANGSIGQVELIDSSDGLDIVYKPDPSITSDKMSYVENGIEPGGVLRAVLECWAGTGASDVDKMQKDTFKKMQDRVNTPIGTNDAWSEKIITTLFDIILKKYKTNGEMIRVMADAAMSLDEMHFEDEARVKNLTRANVDIGKKLENDMVTIFTALSGEAHWTGNPFVPLVIYQIWMMKDGSKQTNFMSTMTSFTSATASDFIDAKYLGNKSKVATLLPPGTTSPTRNQLLLAFVLVNTSKPLDADAKKFLLDVLAGKTRFDNSLNVAPIMGGNPTERSVLETIGAIPSPSSSVSPSAKNANMDLDGDGTNETYVEPLWDIRGESSVKITPHEMPDSTSKTITPEIDPGKKLFIIGQSGAYYAIHNPDKPRQTVFVQKSEVNKL